MLEEGAQLGRAEGIPTAHGLLQCVPAHVTAGA